MNLEESTRESYLNFSALIVACRSHDFSTCLIVALYSTQTSFTNADATLELGIACLMKLSTDVNIVLKLTFSILTKRNLFFKVAVRELRERHFSVINNGVLII